MKIGNEKGDISKTNYPGGERYKKRDFVPVESG